MEDKQALEEKLIPLVKGKRILLAPASKASLEYLDLLKTHSSFLGFYDGKETLKSFSKHPVFSPRSVFDLAPEIVLNTSISYAEEIEWDLKTYASNVTILNLKSLKKRLRNSKKNKTEPTKNISSKNHLPNKSSSPLKILFIQNQPCIRNYKYATALKAKGYAVTLAYTIKKLSECYPLDDSVYEDSVKICSDRELKEFCKTFDIIHNHNEPDILALPAIESGKPLIHDTHDISSLKTQGPSFVAVSALEGFVQKKARACIYSTEEQKRVSEKKHDLKNKQTLVFGNYISSSHTPTQFLKKLSKDRKEIHVVYEGCLGWMNHRDFRPLLRELLSMDSFHIHIHPPFPPNKKYRELSQFFPNLHLHDPISPNEIISIMTQYDVGIIPFTIFEDTQDFLDTTIANKLYEYLAAGLPVITSKLKSYQNFFQKNPIGFCYENAKDIQDRLPELLRTSQDIDFSDYLFTYEDHIDELIAFYHDVTVKHNAEKSGENTYV